MANAAGLFPAIYLPVGSNFKFIFKDAADVTIWTQDGIAAAPSPDDLGEVSGTAGQAIASTQVVYLSDGSGGRNAGQWYLGDATVAYGSINVRVGFPVADIDNGLSGSIRQTGRIAGLSGLIAGTTYYISAATPGALTATAPTNKRAIGVADSATSLILLPGPSWTDLNIPITQTTTTAGTQNDFAISPGPSIFLRCNNATALNLTGFAGGIAGKQIIVSSVGAGTVTLVHATGTAANQILTDTAANVVLLAGNGRATVVYDATSSRWILVSKVGI